MAPSLQPPASPFTDALGYSGSSETLQALMSFPLPSSYPGQGLHPSPAASSIGLFPAGAGCCLSVSISLSLVSWPSELGTPFLLALSNIPAPLQLPPQFSMLKSLLKLWAT